MSSSSCCSFNSPANTEPEPDLTTGPDPRLDEIDNKGPEACIEMAEELFKENKIDAALALIDKARQRFSKHDALDRCFACYVVLKLAAEKKSFYSVLGFLNPHVGLDAIKKRHESLLRLTQRCSSIGANKASMLINGAWRVLSDPQSREAYDALLLMDPANVGTDCLLQIYNKLAVKYDPPENKPALTERSERNNGSPTAATASAAPPSKLHLIVNQDPQENVPAELLNRKRGSPTASTASSASPAKLLRNQDPQENKVENRGSRLPTSSKLHAEKVFLVTRNCNHCTGNSTSNKVFLIRRKPNRPQSETENQPQSENRPLTESQPLTENRPPTEKSVSSLILNIAVSK